jgi:hypothetical protein
MSFGYSVGDFFSLTQLAWKVVQNSRKACGAHDELTGEVTRLHIILQRLELEMSNPESLLSRNDIQRKELADLSSDCNKVLRVLSQVTEKYNAISDKKRTFKKFRQMIQFGNGEMLDLSEVRLKIATYMHFTAILLNLLSMGSQGRVERYMDSQSKGLREIQHSINWIVASLQAKSREGSTLTSYAEDNKTFWKDFRRECIKAGFSSSVLSRNKRFIEDYIKELGSRGALDDIQNDEQDSSVKEEVELYTTVSLRSAQARAPGPYEVTALDEPARYIPTAEGEDEEVLQEDVSDAEGQLESFQVDSDTKSTIRNEKAIVQPGIACIRRAQEKERQVVKAPQLEALEQRRNQMDSAAKVRRESRDLQRRAPPVGSVDDEIRIEVGAVLQHSDVFERQTVNYFPKQNNGQPSQLRLFERPSWKSDLLGIKAWFIDDFVCEFSRSRSFFLLNSSSFGELFH